MDTINAFARQGYRVRITCCTCGNEVVWNPIELIGKLQQRRMSLSVEGMEQRMKCSGCGARQAIIRPSFVEDD